MIFYIVKIFIMGLYGVSYAIHGHTMIDLHCHILPGLDDGSDSPDTSCRMAAMAADCGVRYIVATPHCNTRDERKNYRSEALTQAFLDLQAELDHWQIPIRILPGAEILIRDNFARLLDEGRLLSINDSRYLLVEFYFDEDPGFMEEQLSVAEARGFVPVIAHPERYFCVQDNPSTAARWAERGRILQLNSGSILGDLGEPAYDTAALLLRWELVPVIASDAHDYRRRSTNLLPLIDTLGRRFPSADPEELLWRNPMKLVRNHTLR